MKGLGTPLLSCEIQSVRMIGTFQETFVSRKLFLTLLLRKTEVLIYTPVTHMATPQEKVASLVVCRAEVRGGCSASFKN